MASCIAWNLNLITIDPIIELNYLNWNVGTCRERIQSPFNKSLAFGQIGNDPKFKFPLF